MKTSPAKPMFMKLSSVKFIAFSLTIVLFLGCDGIGYIQQSSKRQRELEIQIDSLKVERDRVEFELDLIEKELERRSELDSAEN